jgi:WD40 repeat protein
LILWDVGNGQPICHCQGHTDNVYRLKFSQDGRTALSTPGDRTLILWDISSLLDASIRLRRIDSLEQLIAGTTGNRYVPELTW